MPHRRLPNYLKTYRKRAGLTQDEVAFLLGCTSGAKVSRYERLARRPGLETAFAYEALFRVPARELFAGVFRKVEDKVIERAQLLAEKLRAVNPDSVTARKLELLDAIASNGSAESPHNP